MSSGIASGVVLLGIAGIAYAGVNNRLPPNLQSGWNTLFGGSASGSTAGVGGASGSTACTPAAIASWASGIGLSPSVGKAFCADHGRLPNGLPELNDWGTQKGYKHSDGSWSVPGG